MRRYLLKMMKTFCKWLERDAPVSIKKENRRWYVTHTADGYILQPKSDALIIEALKKEDSGANSMRVGSQGGMTMAARDVRRSKRYKELIEKSSEIVDNSKT